MHTEMEQMAGSMQHVCDAGDIVQSATSCEGRDVLQQQIK